MIFQEMVAEGRFRVWRNSCWQRTDASWIKSVVTMQTPHQGSLGAHIFRARYTDTGVLLPFLTPAHACSMAALLYDKWAPTWMQRVFEVESPFSSEWRKKSLRECLSTNTYFSGRDTALWELSPNYARQVLQHVRLHPDIYYFSLATCCTHLIDSDYVEPDSAMFAPLRVMARFLGNTASSSGDETDARHNDGLVPLKSQRAPIGHRWAHLKVTAEGLPALIPVEEGPMEEARQMADEETDSAYTQSSDSDTDNVCGKARCDTKIPKGRWLVSEGRGDHLYYMFCPRRHQFYTDFFGQLFHFLRHLK